jgi:hypothetical protein
VTLNPRGAVNRECRDNNNHDPPAGEFSFPTGRHQARRGRLRAARAGPDCLQPNKADRLFDAHKREDRVMTDDLPADPNPVVLHGHALDLVADIGCGADPRATALIEGALKQSYWRGYIRGHKHLKRERGRPRSARGTPIA